MELREGMGVFTPGGEQVGTVNRFVLDPGTNEVTHIVIQKGWLLPEDKVVPFEMVSSATGERVVLSEEVGDFDKLPPFEHNGKQAYRCDVFNDAGGKQFVGLIYRFTDSGRKQMEEYLPKKSQDVDGAARRALEERGMQVKPIAATGDAAWRYADDITVAQLRAAVKTSSKQQATLVQP